MSAVQDLMPGKHSLSSTSRHEIEGVGRKTCSTWDTGPTTQLHSHPAKSPPFQGRLALVPSWARSPGDAWSGCEVDRLDRPLPGYQVARSWFVIWRFNSDRGPKGAGRRAGSDCMHRRRQHTG